MFLQTAPHAQCHLITEIIMLPLNTYVCIGNFINILVLIWNQQPLKYKILHHERPVREVQSRIVYGAKIQSADLL